MKNDNRHLLVQREGEVVHDCLGDHDARLYVRKHIKPGETWRVFTDRGTLWMLFDWAEGTPAPAEQPV